MKVLPPPLVLHISTYEHTKRVIHLFQHCLLGFLLADVKDQNLEVSVYKGDALTLSYVSHHATLQLLIDRLHFLGINQGRLCKRKLTS